MASLAPSPTPNSQKKKKEKKKQDTYYEDTSFDLGQYMLYLFPIGIFAGVIAWWKNSQSNIIMRIIYVIIAYLFNVFYLIYSVYRWFTYRPPQPVVAPTT